jgi:hypothetical protein
MNESSIVTSIANKVAACLHSGDFKTVFDVQFRKSGIEPELRGQTWIAVQNQLKAWRQGKIRKSRPALPPSGIIHVPVQEQLFETSRLPD